MGDWLFAVGLGLWVAVICCGGCGFRGWRWVAMVVGWFTIGLRWLWVAVVMDGFFLFIVVGSGVGCGG